LGVKIVTEKVDKMCDCCFIEREYKRKRIICSARSILRVNNKKRYKYFVTDCLS
jgi:hypothetical protein